MKVLVIGDAMTDVYWTGTATRLSPEACVPVVSVKGTETRPGGAANVASNIEAMGVPVERIFGGGDRILKMRLLAGKQHVARIDFDHPQQPIALDAAFTEAVGRCDIVVMVDYGKGALANVQALIQACAGKPVLVDPKGHDYSKYRGATLIKPNRDEMKELVGGWSTQDELDFKARQFLVSSGIESILLTQAAEGMTLYTKTETLHEPSQNLSPTDVSGAGEAVLSAYATALAKGFKPAERLQYAAKAAGLACSRQGTTVCTEEEVFGPR